MTTDLFRADVSSLFIQSTRRLHNEFHHRLLNVPRSLDPYLTASRCDGSNQRQRPSVEEVSLDAYVPSTVFLD